MDPWFVTNLDRVPDELPSHLGDRLALAALPDQALGPLLLQDAGGGGARAELGGERATPSVGLVPHPPWSR